jgi:hypothetical protein
MSHSIEAAKNPPQAETQPVQPVRAAKTSAPKQTAPQHDTVNISSAGQAASAGNAGATKPKG